MKKQWIMIFMLLFFITACGGGGSDGAGVGGLKTETIETGDLGENGSSECNIKFSSADKPEEVFFKAARLSQECGIKGEDELYVFIGRNLKNL